MQIYGKNRMSGRHIPVPAMSGFEDGQGDRIKFCICCTEKLDKCACVWSAIRDLQDKVPEHWDLNYKAHENMSKRISKLEDNDYDERLSDLERIEAECRLLELEKVVSNFGNKAEKQLVAHHYLELNNAIDQVKDELSKEIAHIEARTIETWQQGCEVQINILMKCNKELEERIKQLESQIISDEIQGIHLLSEKIRKLELKAKEFKADM